MVQELDIRYTHPQDACETAKKTVRLIGQDPNTLLALALEATMQLALLECASEVCQIAKVATSALAENMRSNDETDVLEVFLENLAEEIEKERA